MARAGKLDRRVTFEEPVEQRSTTGALTNKWQLLAPNASSWAEKIDLQGRELFQAQQINAQVTTQFTVRYRSTVNARMRLVCEDVLYTIHAVMEGRGRRVWTVLLCSRSAN